MKEMASATAHTPRERALRKVACNLEILRAIRPEIRGCFMMDIAPKDLAWHVGFTDVYRNLRVFPLIWLSEAVVNPDDGPKPNKRHMCYPKILLCASLEAQAVYQ